MRKIFLASIILFILTGCSNFNNFLGADPLRGTWKGQTSEDGYLVFKENNVVEILDGNMEKKNISTKYESITELEPHQLYVIVEFEGKSERMPLGIYKIENNKLILRSPTEYHKSIGFIDAGISRYEMPKDFSGVVAVYEKIN